MFIVSITSILAIGILSYAAVRRSDEPTTFDSAQIPVLLANDMRVLETTTYALNESLNDYRSDTANRRARYIAHMESLAAACSRIAAYGTEAMIEAATPDMQSLLRQSTGICRDLRPLATASGRHYRALEPLFSVPAGLRRYDYWPGFSAYRQRQIKQSLVDSQRQLGRLDKHDDSGSLNGLRLALDQASERIPAAQGLDAQIQEVNAARDHTLAIRVSYWRTYIGIEGLLTSERNILASVCGPLSVGGDKPDACTSR